MTPETVNLGWVRGDDPTLRLQVTNKDGSAFDLTGHTIRYIVKANRNDADSAALITKTITETLTGAGQILAPATSGLADIFIDDTDTLGRTVPPANPPVDLSLEEEGVKYFQGFKKKTSTGKFLTVAIGEMRLTREIMGAF